MVNINTYFKTMILIGLIYQGTTFGMKKNELSNEFIVLPYEIYLNIIKNMNSLGELKNLLFVSKAFHKQTNQAMRLDKLYLEQKPFKYYTKEKLKYLRKTFDQQSLGKFLKMGTFSINFVNPQQKTSQDTISDTTFEEYLVEGNYFNQSANELIAKYTLKRDGCMHDITHIADTIKKNLFNGKIRLNLSDEEKKTHFEEIQSWLMGNSFLYGDFKKIVTLKTIDSVENNGVFAQFTLQYPTDKFLHNVVYIRADDSNAILPCIGQSINSNHGKTILLLSGNLQSALNNLPDDRASSIKVIGIDGKNNNSGRIPHIQKCCNVEKLVAKSCGFKFFPDLSTTRLKTIDLSGNDIKSIEEKNVPQSLRLLDITNNSIKDTESTVKELTKNNTSLNVRISKSALKRINARRLNFF